MPCVVAAWTLLYVISDFLDAQRGHPWVTPRLVVQGLPPHVLVLFQLKGAVPCFCVLFLLLGQMQRAL